LLEHKEILKQQFLKRTLYKRTGAKRRDECIHGTKDERRIKRLNIAKPFIRTTKKQRKRRDDSRMERNRRNRRFSLLAINSITKQRTNNRKQSFSIQSIQSIHLSTIALFRHPPQPPPLNIMTSININIRIMNVFIIHVHGS
jgi:hypothetical protein